LTFCWTCHLAVTAASHDAGVHKQTAVDYYSMCREVTEVIISNEVMDRPLGREDAVVEVDECFLTRRKYSKGRVTKTGTVTILGFYERETGLGFHVQVRDKSSAVLLSEIERFVVPGTRNRASLRTATNHIRVFPPKVSIILYLFAYLFI